MRIANRVKRARMLLLGLAAIAVLTASAAPAADDIAFVVRPDLPVDNLPLAELSRMKFWRFKKTSFAAMPSAWDRS